MNRRSSPAFRAFFCNRTPRWCNLAVGSDSARPPERTHAFNFFFLSHNEADMAVEFALMESLENRQLLTVPFFHQTNLVSDVSTIGALHHDANLKNPWGLAAVSN